MNGCPPSRYAFLDGPLPLAMAHRGGAIEHLENTMPAFEACVRLGYRYLETDVRVTADGVLVAFHDGGLERVTDRTGRLEQLTWAEVSEARIGGREPILRLEDLLGRLAGRPVQPRHQGGRRPDAARAHRCAGWGSPTASASAPSPTPASPRPGGCSARRCAPRSGRAGSRRCGMSSYSPRAAGLVRIQAGCAQVPLQLGGRALVDERFLAAAHARGLQVHVWTVDTVEESTALLDLGVDGLMTDRPAMLRELLEQRGQWTPR